MLTNILNTKTLITALLCLAGAIIALMAILNANESHVRQAQQNLTKGIVQTAPPVAPRDYQPK